MHILTDNGRIIGAGLQHKVPILVHTLPVVCVCVHVVCVCDILRQQMLTVWQGKEWWPGHGTRPDVCHCLLQAPVWRSGAEVPSLFHKGI